VEERAVTLHENLRSHVLEHAVFEEVSARAFELEAVWRAGRDRRCLRAGRERLHDPVEHHGVVLAVRVGVEPEADGDGQSRSDRVRRVDVLDREGDTGHEMVLAVEQAVVVIARQHGLHFQRLGEIDGLATGGNADRQRGHQYEWRAEPGGHENPILDQKCVSMIRRLASSRGILPCRKAARSAPLIVRTSVFDVDLYSGLEIATSTGVRKIASVWSSFSVSTPDRSRIASTIASRTYSEYCALAVAVF